MIHRICNPLKSNSFFLFGPRGTGKTSMLKEVFGEQEPLWIDLLKAADEQRYINNPDALIEVVSVRNKAPEWVIIDEVQKAPNLLDVVHHLIEERKIKFALTGSSARKLKRGAANLLAGRAYVYHLFPLTHRELSERFNLHDSLRWGTLPKIFSIDTENEKSLYLESYAQTYLKEEILSEQLIRSIAPFRKFLEISGQTSGTIVNFKAIAGQIGADPKSVKKYYEILEDTLLGFFLPAYHRSLRKQQRLAPKFFLFDIGVRRAIEGVSQHPLPEGTYEFGRAFEEFIITEAVRLNSYGRKNFKFSYILTEGGAEVDLVIERPGMKTVLVEIKSSSAVLEQRLNHLVTFKKDYPEFEAICLSREPHPRRLRDVTIYPWQEGLVQIGL